MEANRAKSMPDLTGVVVIIDTDDTTYTEHHVVGTVGECAAFVEGMIAAWKISHGPSNSWTPFALGVDHQRAEWEEMGSPGIDKIREALGCKA